MRFGKKSTQSGPRPGILADVLGCGTGNATAPPTGLDCNFESICERCGFFETGPQFLTILRRQRDDAVGHGQEDRAQLLEGFIDDIDSGA